MTVESTIPEQWCIYSQSVNLLSLPRVNRSCTCERNMHVTVPLLVNGSCMCEQYLQLAWPYHIPWHCLPGHTISHAITRQAISYTVMPTRLYHLACHGCQAIPYAREAITRPHTVPAIAGIPAFSPPRSISRFAQIRGENLGGGGGV